MLGGYVLIALYSFYCMVGYDGRTDSARGKSLEVMAGDRNFHEPIRMLAFSAFVAVAIQSLVSPHHELRFLQPMMVAWCLIIGHVVGYEVARMCGNHPMGTIRKAKILTYATLIPAVLHVILGVYLLTSHQSGTEAAFKFIQQRILSRPLSWSAPGGVYRTVNIHLLAQCHSFPGYSHLHANSWRQNQQSNMAHILPKIHMYDCSPSRDEADPGQLTTAATESRKFESDPQQFARDLQTRLGFFRPYHNANILQAKEFKAPDVLVTFDCFQKEVESAFAGVLGRDVDSSEQTARKKSQEMPCGSGNIDACVAIQDEELLRRKENKYSSNKLRLVATFDHADFRYDYDDAHIKRKVLVYSRF